ncbi:MAG TPA: hypothetical protein VMM13_16060 [Euzebya sp.]|nr:hypothetical protein [Euzebya sp.]
MKPIVLTRPLPVRVVAAATLAAITGWAALSRDLSDFGVLAYPAIIALQTAREWLWRLEVTTKGLYEKQGIGAPRELSWAKVEAVLTPEAAWWRVNPVLKIAEAPNVQMTAAADVGKVIDMARAKRKEIIGRPESVSVSRSLAPWVVLLMLAVLLLSAEIVEQTAGAA